MRIPTEATALYLSESERKAFAEKTRTGPIGESAGLRSTLSESVPEKPRARKPDKNAAHKNLVPQDPVYSEKRRQQERRKSHQSVVLDTRLKQRRQETCPNSSVNFEI